MNELISDQNSLKYFNLKSYLSNEVHNLIQPGLTINSSNYEEFGLWLEKSKCLLNIDLLNEKVIKFNDEQSERMDYLSSIQSLAPYLDPIRINLELNLDLGCSRFLGSDLCLIQSHVLQSGSYKPLSHLILYSVLERCLGNLLFSLNNRGQVPFLLRDLLNERLLESFLGQSLMNFLRLFLCGPKSLNLRNLAWHGFLNPDQYSTSYCYFLLALIVQIDSKLENVMLIERPKFNVSTLSPSTSNIDAFKLSFSNGDLLPKYDEIISNSVIIDDSRRDLWRLISGSEISSYSRLILLLPEIEHVLRKLYACVNRIEDNSCQIAYTNEFYLTMDDLLACDKLTSSLDSFLVLVIRDMFNYADGPRIRDRISHGEIDSTSIDDLYYSNVLLFIAISLAACRRDLFSFSYEPDFHPIAVLKKDLFQLIDHEIDANICFDLDDAGPNLDHLENLINRLGGEPKSSDLRSKMSLANYRRLITRYEQKLDFKQKEIQLINLLRNITKCIAQYQQKLGAKLIEEQKPNLRERQRNNLRQFQQSQNVFRLFLRLTKCILAYLIDRYLISIELEKSDNKLSVYDLYETANNCKFDYLTKFLKNLLKLAQNLNFKFDENKWNESVELILNNDRIKFDSDNFLQVFFY